MSRIIGWLIAAAFLLAAWGTTLILPSDTAFRDAYVTMGDIGESIETRNLVVTVHDAMLVDSITDPTGMGVWQGEANWLVFDVSAQLTVDENAGSLVTNHVWLGGDRYTASERLETVLSRSPLSIAYATRGYLVFEIPQGVNSGEVRLDLGNGAYKYAPGVASVKIDLSKVTHQPSLELTHPEREERQ